MSPFKERVARVISLVPPGKVVSYGQVALMVGLPRAARQVGWILRSLGPNDNLPWWRVINNEGRISIKGNLFCTPEMQKRLLESEGIKVVSNLTLDIEKFRFRPTKKQLRSFQLPDDYIELVLKKYLPFSSDLM